MRSACLAGLCACLDRKASAAVREAGGPAQSEAPKQATVAQKWIVALLPALGAVEREQARRILKSCCHAHFEDLNMKAVTGRFRGRSSSGRRGRADPGSGSRVFPLIIGRTGAAKFQ